MVIPVTVTEECYQLHNEHEPNAPGWTVDKKFGSALEKICLFHHAISLQFIHVGHNSDQLIVMLSHPKCIAFEGGERE